MNHSMTNRNLLLFIIILLSVNTGFRFYPHLYIYNKQAEGPGVARENKWKINYKFKEKNLSTTNFSPFGPAVLLTIGNECLVLLKY